jgi:hypothetical protein
VEQVPLKEESEVQQGNFFKENKGECYFWNGRSLVELDRRKINRW